ncbi:helix-turn-helix transcriptional regulator [Paenibacillus sp. IB182496]|uniref:Helix-turn-helix transcriptional regulator n=1 Tax=Paenibacillus sabuli TaxID=2772509 RepID=A0A927BXH7_9BACL|nr:AraC family transcriptional regulator [Paenibacillus sabuli]MBD2847701.1 helix-turn-helix transcriptional regulator [Paenibacillus sabuli]
MPDRYPELDEMIAFIQRHLHEPLTLARLAQYAAYSPYHFTRIFKERMGLSPLYYISALRLQKAKDLLLSTQLSVRDIGLEIGQQSLGTFTTRFTARVGMTPAQFRNSRQQAERDVARLHKLGELRERMPLLGRHSVVRGRVRAPLPLSGVVLVGLFARPIPEGLPLHGTLVSGEAPFTFGGVKPGTYYLMATSVAWGTDASDILLTRKTLRTRDHAPIVVGEGSKLHEKDAVLHPPSPDDPPILISLPVLMERFLSRVGSTSSPAMR